ncbi:uncharacterized protein [Montipora foliosa]|uniref:uncharacterized protein n=1 Tax=Montipora foliosa TaxID=591990 RepID=UPI0035F1A09F
MYLRVWYSVAILLSRIGVIGTDDQCNTGEIGMFLNGHTFKTVQVGLPYECSRVCDQEARCQSYNVLFSRNLCELNSRTKEARPNDFLPDLNRFYRKRTLNRVPLGTIQELAARSCGEIKQSEGKEMENKEYWIYSDENATQAILANCEDYWQKINIGPVCFGARGDTYGNLIITKTGLIRTMKLVHKSGTIRCNPNTTDSYWTCMSDLYTHKLMTIITNAAGDALLPPIGELEALNSPHPNKCQRKHFYSLSGTESKSPELVFRNFSSPLLITQGEELQIWHGQDWSGCYESRNTGSTCVDVYAWYI